MLHNYLFLSALPTLYNVLTSVLLVLIATASNAIDLWEFDKPSLLHIITAAVTLFNYSLYCDIQAYF